MCVQYTARVLAVDVLLKIGILSGHKMVGKLCSLIIIPIQGDLFVFRRRLRFLYAVKSSGKKLSNLAQTLNMKCSQQGVQLCWAKWDNFLLHTKIWAIHAKRDCLIECILKYVGASNENAHQAWTSPIRLAGRAWNYRLNFWGLFWMTMKGKSPLTSLKASKEAETEIK